MGEGYQHFLAFPTVRSVSRSSLCRPGDRAPRRRKTRPADSRRGRDPPRLRFQPPETLRPAEAGGGGTRGGLCAVGAGPRRLLCTTIGRELRTGGRTSQPGPTLLAMSSDCCTPNLSIYSTGIEAAGAALALANHGWDFLFRPLFVSFWDLRRCHRF